MHERFLERNMSLAHDDILAQINTIREVVEVFDDADVRAILLFLDFVQKLPRAWLITIYLRMRLRVQGGELRNIKLNFSCNPSVVDSSCAPKPFFQFSLNQKQTTGHEHVVVGDADLKEFANHNWELCANSLTLLAFPLTFLKNGYSLRVTPSSVTGSPTETILWRFHTNRYEYRVWANPAYIADVSTAIDEALNGKTLTGAS